MNKQNDAFWQVKKRAALRDEYNTFLKQTGHVQNPHAAHLFAMQKLAGLPGYELTEREIILELAGELPPMYD